MEEISDLIIRNGKIIDGSGGPEILSDILIKDGKIEKIEKISSSINVKKEIDANGFIVTPGFVDIHTHYDGQATWDNFIPIFLAWCDNSFNGKLWRRICSCP